MSPSDLEDDVGAPLRTTNYKFGSLRCSHEEVAAFVAGQRMETMSY